MVTLYIGVTILWMHVMIDYKAAWNIISQSKALKFKFPTNSKEMGSFLDKTKLRLRTFDSTPLWVYSNYKILVNVYN